MKIPSIKLADPADPPSVVVDVAVTLEDQVRFVEHLHDRPEYRRRRRRFTAFMLLAGPPIGMLAGVLLSGAGASLPAIVRGRPDVGWLLPIFASLVISGILAAVVALLGLARRPLLRRQIRRVLAHRPGVDPLDPELREPCRCTFDAKGYSTQGPSTLVQVDWSVIHGLDEVDGLLVLRAGGPYSGYILPLRDMSDAQAQAIRNIVRDYLGNEPSRSRSPAYD